MNRKTLEDQFWLGGSKGASWALNARRLKRSGDLVLEANNNALERMMDSTPLPSDIDTEIAGCAMLLYGLSLENLIKGVIIANNPSLASRTAAPRWRGNGHELTQLFDQAEIELDDPDKDIVFRLSAFVTWAGRYPIPKSVDKMVIRQDGFSRPYFPMPFGRREMARFNRLFGSLINRLVRMKK